MPVPPFLATPARVLALGASILLAAGSARAQDQNRIDHILTPDRTLAAHGFDRAFGAAASPAHRGFFARLFDGSRPSTVGTGRSSFHAVAFSAKNEGFATEGFTTRALPDGGKSLTGTDRSFDPKTMDVRANAAADRRAAVKPYGPLVGRDIPQGKKQDDIDDLRRQKNLTIDQVREILNKKK